MALDDDVGYRIEAPSSVYPTAKQGN